VLARNARKTSRRTCLRSHYGRVFVEILGYTLINALNKDELDAWEKGMHGETRQIPGYGCDIVQVVAAEGSFNDSPRNTLSKNRTAVRLGREVHADIYIYITHCVRLPTHASLFVSCASHTV
jgi:hypothetical protein